MKTNENNNLFFFFLKASATLLMALSIPLLLLTESLCADSDFKLPDNVQVIEERAFENTVLSDDYIELPESLLFIGSRAFAGSSVQMIQFPRSIQDIAADAFDGCEYFQPVVYSGSYAEKWCTANNITPYVIIGLGVTSHSQQEINDFISSHPSSMYYADQFSREPTGGEMGGDIYNYGLLTEDTLANAINMVNQVRFIAGLNADVVNAPEWENAMGAISLVNALNGKIAHKPERPEALADEQYNELYQLACTGGSNSNLYYGGGSNLYTRLGYAVLSLMKDSGKSNISIVGHRRWILNPSMSRTTFGLCLKTDTTYGKLGFVSMYAFDETGNGVQKRVAWPAQQTPLTHFINSSEEPWSVSYGTILNSDKIHVTLQRESDGATWAFSAASADGDFYVNNGYYGQTGCVIFRPKDVGTISAGDVFHVSIENAGDYTILRYDVTFF